ncbi:MAG: hypothetical protein DHS20C20_33560 [Ardenticatenaceae bacterium]|nr:MAG: hypothetical protein DHS20C20_33560 [Ardenticatenaceae bacterium]
MEFDEMKLIWDSQNNEPLFAIDQDALHNRIQNKGQAVASSMNKFDLLMIGMNLLVGIVLLVDNIKDEGAAFEYVLPIVYLLFFAYSIYRRYAHKQEVRQFPPTVLGDLDKALWQVNYLIKQNREMMVWYLLPILVVAFVTVSINAGFVWSLGVILLAAPVAYFGGRWEVNKWYLPKKRELDSLRELLLKAEDGPKA